MDRHRQIQIQKAIEFLEATNVVSQDRLKMKIDLINRCSEDSPSTNEYKWRPSTNEYKWRDAYNVLFFNGAEYKTFMPYFEEKAIQERHEHERRLYEQKSESISQSEGQS